MRDLLRKSFSVLTVAATMFYSVGLTAFVPTASAAVASGSLIKASGAAVYYMGADGKRYVFPDQKTYFTWYPDFSGVITITDSELASITIGGNVTYRPGVKLAKINTDPKVYAVAAHGVLRWVTSEAIAAALYGSAWSTQVQDISDAFFTNYTIGAPINAASEYDRAAELAAATSINVDKGLTTGPVSTGTSVTVSLASDTPAARPVIAGEVGADLAHFKFTNNGSASATVNGLLLKRIGVSSDSALAKVYLYDGATRLTDYATVSSSTIIFNTASGIFTIAAGASKTISVKADIDAAATAGQSVGIQIPTAGAVTGSLTAGGSFPISGNTFNIAVVTDLAGVDFASASAQPLTSTIDAAADVRVFESNITVSQRSVYFTGMTLREIGSVNYSDLSNFRLFVSGVLVATTASLDGNGYVTLTPSAGYTLTTGTKTLKVLADVLGGTSRTFSFSLRNATDFSAIDSNYNVSVAPKVAGSTFVTVSTGTVTINAGSLSVQKATDSPSGNVLLAGTDVLLAKYNVKAYGESVKIDSLLANFAYTPSPSTLQVSTVTVTGVAGTSAVTINGTTVSVPFNTDATTTATDLFNAINANVTVAAIVTATNPSAGVVSVAKDAVNGQPASFTIVDASSGGMTGTVATPTPGVGTVNTNAAATLRNAKVMANGAQVGSLATLLQAASTTSFNVNMTVVPGTPVVLEIRADIYDNDGTGALAAGDTLRASLVAGTNNAQGVSSGTVISTATVLANTVTVSTSVATLSKYNSFPDQIVVAPATATKIGSFVVAVTGDDTVTLNSVTADFAGTGSFAVAQMSDVYAVVAGTQTSLKSTVTATGNLWSVSKTMTKNDSAIIDVYASLDSNFVAAGTLVTTLNIDYNTQVSGSSATTGAVAGQTINAGASTITAVVAPTTPLTALVPAGVTTDVTAVRFTTTNESYNVTDMTVSVGVPASGVTINVVLKDGTTVLATKPLSGTTASFSSLSIPVASNGAKIITIALQLGTVGSGGGASGADLTTTLTAFKATSSSGVPSNQTGLTVAGNPMFVYAVVPTIANVALPVTVLSAGNKTISKFSVSAAGPTGAAMSWKKLLLNVNVSANITGISNIAIYDAAGNAIATTTATYGAPTITIVLTNEQQVAAGSSATYEVRADIAGPAITTNDYVSTNIAHPAVLLATVSDTYANVAATTATFVWSDQSASGHLETTTDWHNDAYVKNLPTPSQTLGR